MKYTTPTAEHYPHSTDNTRLSEPHHRMLVEESGIDEGIVEERGYFTARRTSEIPGVFKGWLRRLGLVVPMNSPDSVTTLPQLRANKPWTNKKGKPLRYMTPAHAETIIDVHPRNMEKVADPSEPLWITEGVKKGDAMTTHGLCAISLPGVWNFGVRGTHGKELKECWDHVALQGRDVYVVYDSDVMDKDEVKQALQQLVTALEGRGASVRVVYLPDAPDGSKQGVDDYLVAGGTVDEMYNMARPFEPSDYVETRLSRDQKLSAAIEAQEAAWRNHEWVAKGKPRSSRRKVWRGFIDEIKRSGDLVDGALHVTYSERQAAERTGLSRVTAHKAIDGLEEEEGVLLRDSRKGKAIHEASTYTLPVPSNSYCVTQLYHHGNDSPSVDDSSASRPALSNTPLNHAAPLHSGLVVSRNDSDEVTQTAVAALEELKRLRWSYTARSRTKEGFEYQYVERIGPIPGEAFEILLLEFGGDAHAKTLSKAMGRDESPSRFIERVGSKMENAGMVRITEDQRLIVLDSWPANLGLAREMGGEYIAERLTKERHERQREGFRLALRHPTRPSKPPEEPVRTSEPVEEADGYIEDLERVEEEVEPIVEEVPVEPEVPVEDHHEHDLACECIDCSIPVPMYAIPYARAA